MGPPLILLLLLAAPNGAPQQRSARMMAARSESVSAVDHSASQRFGWIDRTARPPVAAPERPLPARPDAIGRGALGLFPGAVRESDLARLWPAQAGALGVVRAARWVDALPVKLDVQDGGLTLTLKLSGP